MALGSFSAGAVLAWNHPLWPIAALAVFGLWCAMVAWRPGIWLFVVPACLPFLNFSPWTGWIVFEEFDILLLGALAGGYGRLAGSSQSGGGIKMTGVMLTMTALLGGTGWLAMCRGFLDANGFVFDWFAGYTDALNSLRVFKSLGFALLFIPLLPQKNGYFRRLANQRLAIGMVSGLAVASLAVLWERAAFPGIADFSTPYRTVALFWEMHVGGSAIDAYLAMTMPFVVWALLSARRPVFWAAAAALALLASYACLTTFARGVYFAVAIPLMLLGILLRAQQPGFNARAFLMSIGRRYRPGGWRAKAGLLLLLALAAELAAVLGGGSFMRERLTSINRDLSGRVEHWRQGFELLDGTSDWLLGKGLGRTPTHYSRQVSQSEFSGAVKVRDEQAPEGRVNGFVSISGPDTMEKLGGQFALTQRVGKVSKGGHRISLDVRVQKKADVYLELCERHLLYDGACLAAMLHVVPGDSAWQTVSMPLEGLSLDGGPRYAARFGVFSVSVVNAGGIADVDNIKLISPQREQLLQNGDFFNRLAQWLPAAQSYFLPWHIDNLYLEFLVERGVTGLLIFVAWVMYALWHLVFGRARMLALSPYLAAAVSAALLLGLVSSLMDVPRVAFLFFLLTVFSIQTTQEVE